MTSAKSIAAIVPGIMSVGLLGNTLQVLPKKGKKVKPQKMVNVFATTMIGVPLIGATSNMISKLP